MDFKSFQSIDPHHYLDELKRQSQDLILNLKLEPEQIEGLKLDKISSFLSSDLGQILIQNADQVQRERAFSYLVDANKLLRDSLNEVEGQQLSDSQILLHGVIDAFLIKDSKFILIDYKTDRYRPLGAYSKEDQIQALVDKYRFQLSLYSQALASAKQLEPYKVYLILLDFEKYIEMNNLYTF